MPRHADPRLRLTRVSHGYELPPRGTGLAAGGPRFESACRCGLPWCSWSGERAREASRGYKRRRGVWRTADGRFTLEWATTLARSSSKHPGGGLRMWDATLRVESGHESLKAARDEMRRRYGNGNESE